MDGVILVIAEGQKNEVSAALDGRAPPPCVTGGATRRQSAKAGLEYIAATGGAGNVLIHDAASPVLPHSGIYRLLAALWYNAGAVPVLPVADTLARGTASLGENVDRNDLFRIQTPQAFDVASILKAHRNWNERVEATDDAQMLRAAGHDVALVEGDTMLEKLTYPADFALAEERLARRFSTRTGMGYDVHRLVKGEALWLGGVSIPPDKGLSGHSDPDVALHDLTDAILRAVAGAAHGDQVSPPHPK